MNKIARGFFTEEIRPNDRRLGFCIVTVPEGRKGLLSQKGLPSPYKVGPYGIDLEALEKMGCLSIQQGLSAKSTIIVDEIGKMELFSEKFRRILIDALDSPQKVLATIMQRPHTFSDSIKKRPDTRLLLLNRENFDDVFRKVMIWLDK